MTTNTSLILLNHPDPNLAQELASILSQAGYTVRLEHTLEKARLTLKSQPVSLVILGERLENLDTLDFTEEILTRSPMLPVLLVVENENTGWLKRALRAGVSDCLWLPIQPGVLLETVAATLEKAHARKNRLLREGKIDTASLEQRLNELGTLAELGRTISSSLDIDRVLSVIVDAAVTLTQAEDGSLMLLDENTGELYMRAARNFQDEFVRTLRLPVQDSLVGSVVTTGEPVLFDEQTPHKVKTSFLVHSLLFVPLQMKGTVIGVLGVNNRTRRSHFGERDLKVMKAIAEYAVIALQNAGLHATIIRERNKLETILTRVESGVIVFDHERRLVLVNQAARQLFQIKEMRLVGKAYANVFFNPELTRLVESANKPGSNHTEITLEDARVFSAVRTPIPGVGNAITIHDVSYLKKLDRIKSDFVNTVSHDLRSPLTSIVGYAELIERVGPVNDAQRDFIHRVHVNVQNITKLIDDLFNLGQIESGFNSNRESVRLDKLARLALVNISKRIEGKHQTVQTELTEDFPPLLANPVQMRQMFDKLLDNAVRYTPAGGTITLRSEVDWNQLIFQVIDTGIGIPAADLPFIFDKFYRGSNVPADEGGVGLGMAIVKLIVENHHGRVWVDSTPSRGTTFTVVLPLAVT